MLRFMGPVLVVFAALTAACGGGATSPPPVTGPGFQTPTPVPIPVATVVSGTTLQPDPNAEFTLGDTALLSGGEFVGDQAELTVEEAVVLPETTADGDALFAF